MPVPKTLRIAWLWAVWRLSKNLTTCNRFSQNALYRSHLCGLASKRRDGPIAAISGQGSTNPLTGQVKRAKRTILTLDQFWALKGLAVLPLRAENPEQEKTLVSWKEIASFLDRAERTVRRWERDRGLPVHRVPGGERGGVYAYPGELADWLRGKSSEFEADDFGASDSKSLGSAETLAASDNKIDPMLAEITAQDSRPGIARRLRLAAIAMAAALAGAGIYASFAHPFSNWSQQRNPAIAGTGMTNSIRQVVTPVSDAEKNAAHDLYLKGRFEWNQRTPESLNRALDDFTQAIVHNPNDAYAYAGLADTYEMLFIYGGRQDDDARDKALAGAKKAVELDGSLSQAHRALGYAVWRSGNFVEAEKELHLAIQLDPKDPLAHLWLSNVFAGQGEMDACMREINKAQELDPASASILAVKGDRLYWMGKQQEGIALLNEALHSEPNLGIAHWYVAAIAFQRRDYPTYLKESRTTAELRNDPWLKDVTSKLSIAYARDGESGLLHAEFAVQESCSPPAYSTFGVNRTQKALDCAGYNRIPESLHLLEEASANQDKEFGELKATVLSGTPQKPNSPITKLATIPRFQALIKQRSSLSIQARLPAAHAAGAL